MERPELALDCRNTLGEGILWNEEEARLYWTDIEGRALYRWDPAAPAPEEFPLPEKLCSLAFRRRGGLLLALESGPAFFDPETRELGESLASLRPPGGAIRLNDGRCDRQGRFIVGEFDAEEKGRGKAYRIDPDGKAAELFGGLNSANSTCFSPDGRVMYYSCALRGEIWAFDYDCAAGLPSNRRLFRSFADQPGLPDGSIVDAEGFLWNAQWGGGRVVRFSPEGEVDRVVELPVRNATCLCFGGPDRRTLYITTARMTLSPEELAQQPAAGGIFSYRAGVAGLEETRFRG